MKSYDHITEYISYLNLQHSLEISLHISDSDDIILYGNLYLHNSHTNPYCTRLKFCEAAKRCCLQKQASVTRRAAEGSFVGVCYAGVREIVYPISNGERTVGFISVSGYRAPEADKYIEKISGEYGIPTEELKKAYCALNDNMPDKREIDVLIKPLCAMLELKYIKNKDRGADESGDFAEEVKRYIIQHRREELSISDLCRRFSCSRSYLCHEFKRECGMTVGDFVLKARREDAKYLWE